MREPGRKHPHDPRRRVTPARYNARVRRIGWTALGLVLVAAIAGGGLLLISGDDEGGLGTNSSAGGPPTRSAPAPTPETPRPHRQRRPSKDATRRQVHAAVAQSSVARLDPIQRRVARVARAYVAALDARDGARVCRLFAPEALSGVSFPRDRETCAATLSASIGYRDPRGFPVFAGARVARVAGVTIDGPQARVTATTVTRFADNREPSVEDDLIYLRRAAAGWLIAKPSATLFRAIGVGNIPPQVLAPPR
jgi:hypothetical protein